MKRRVFGSELKSGDVIEVWWSPKRDQIISLRPYTGPLRCFSQGAKLAEFAVNKSGMTIDNGDLYSVIVPEATR